MSKRLILMHSCVICI